MTIRIEIDGTTVTCEEGRTLVDVAAEAGVYIPTLCYLPEHPVLGTCRVCSVKVNGAVAAACAVEVSDGMRVDVNDPETTDARKALVEMLFSEGNHNCPSCEKSGRCTLQAVGYEVDMMVSRFPYQFPSGLPTMRRTRSGWSATAASSASVVWSSSGIARPARRSSASAAAERMPASRSMSNWPTRCPPNRSARPSTSVPSERYSKKGWVLTSLSASGATTSNR